MGRRLTIRDCLAEAAGEHWTDGRVTYTVSGGGRWAWARARALVPVRPGVPVSPVYHGEVVGDKRVIGEAEAEWIEMEELDDDCLPLVQDLDRRGFGPAEQSTDHGVFQVSSSDLEPERQGERIGRRLYKLLIGKLRTQARAGFYLLSHECGTGSTSGDARRVWDSVARRYPRAQDAAMQVIWVGPRRR